MNATSDASDKGGEGGYRTVTGDFVEQPHKMVKEIVEEPPWAIITGGNSNFGKAAALALGRAGFNIYISCRSTVMCARAINVLRPLLPRGIHVEAFEMDLTDFASIRRFAEAVKRQRLMVKLLVHNAGVFCPAAGSATREGVDLSFAVNYMGPFLLTQLLVPEMHRARPARIISLTNRWYVEAKKVDLPYVRAMASKMDLRGQLRVTVHFGKNLEFRSKEPNPFVRVKFLEEQVETELSKNTANPTFNHLMVFKTESMQESVRFEVFHKDKTGEHEIGGCTVRLFELKADGEGLVHSFEQTINIASEEATEGLAHATGKEETLRAKLLAHDRYTLTEDFKLLDLSRRHADSDRPSLSAAAAAPAPAELRAKDFKPRAAEFSHVEVSEKANTVTFVVQKKLNLFKTSHRRIVLDLTNKMLRNETIHGRTRKAFPFQQVLGVLQPDKDDDSKLALTFSKTETVDADGNLLASGGQRDYALHFRDHLQASLFIEVLSPFLISTARFEDGLITFMVQKKLNHFTARLRRLVVDLHQRRLLNMDQKTTHSVESARLQKETGDTDAMLKTFDFAQIHRFLDDAGNANQVVMQFKGGQRRYEVEFLLYEQKIQFLRIMHLFVATNTQPCLHVSLSFIKPPVSRNYRYAHHIPMAARLPAPNSLAAAAAKPWMMDLPIQIPMQPDWLAVDWDTSKVMVDSSRPAGARQPTLSPRMATAQSRLCLVAFTIDMARRLKRSEKGVTAHVLDPGRMDTPMYSKAMGLGAARTLEGWKARMWGAPPSEAAQALLEMATAPLFQEESGLYGHHSGGGRLHVVNIGAGGAKTEHAAHPIKECLDGSKAQQLYDLSALLAMVDFEDPVYSAFLQR